MDATSVLKASAAKQKTVFCLTTKQKALLGLLLGLSHSEGTRVLACSSESKRAFCFAFWKSKSKRFCFLGSFALTTKPVDNMWITQRSATPLREWRGERRAQPAGVTI
jgi:hypothetical protein